jgi:dihydroorotate dehydrogenase electron transfer subunit
MIFDVAAEVMANRRLSPDYNVIALRAPEIARAARPGQFVMIKTAHGMDPMLRRPFSIFEIVRDDEGDPIGVSLLNKRVGVGTALLYDAREGIALSLLGPLGQPFEPVGPDTLAWMVAGGVGLAPFATLAEALVARGTPMTLFYGARTGADLYYRELFASLGATLVLTTEDGSLGEKGRVTAPLERALAAEAADRPVMIYACGPTPMMRAVAAVGERAGRPVFVSLEPVMGCGMGGCYSCVVPVKAGVSATGHFVRSCLEGPVFDAHRLVWDALPAGGH